MSEFQDEKPALTPLVIGLTRSPTLWGVPYMA
ncbi:MAG: type IV secretion system protein VirB3, partial [Mesorhizobium sp.]